MISCQNFLTLFAVGNPVDNHSAHKAKDLVNKMIEKGVKLYYLPPYSSRQNSIEHLWAHVKREWRTAIPVRDKPQHHQVVQAITRSCEHVKQNVNLAGIFQSNEHALVQS